MYPANVKVLSGRRARAPVLATAALVLAVVLFNVRTAGLPSFNVRAADLGSFRGFQKFAQRRSAASGVSETRARASGNGTAVVAGVSGGVDGGGGGGLEAGKVIRLAFFIQLGGATLGHAPRLLRQIWEAGNVYAVHVDAKADAGKVQSLREVLRKENAAYAGNVFFMPAEVITYRGVSMLLNTINAIQMLLDRREQWDYFINLSGSDYPLVPVAVQRELLGGAARGLNFMQFAGQDDWRRVSAWRFGNFYVDEALGFQGVKNTSVLKVPWENSVEKDPGFEYTYGEAWMIISREFCEYVVKSGAARKLLMTLSFSIESSESYFTTLAYNSRFNGSLVDRAMRQVIWRHEGKHHGQHPYYVDEAEGGKFVFRDAVLETSNFYSRKFRNVDSPLMNEIDARAMNAERLKGVRREFDHLVSVAKTRAEEQAGGERPFN